MKTTKTVCCLTFNLVMIFVISLLLSSCQKTDPSNYEKALTLRKTLLDNSNVLGYWKEDDLLRRQFKSFMNSIPEAKKHEVLFLFKSHDKSILLQFVKWAGYDLFDFGKEMSMQSLRLKKMIDEFGESTVSEMVLNKQRRVVHNGEIYEDASECYNNADRCSRQADYNYMRQSQLCMSNYACCYDIGQDYSCCLDATFCESWAALEYQSNVNQCGVDFSNCLASYGH